ncbi:MAG TPA: choice-of-anchor J domain-containing protein [Bacteroidales bacterium]|nr:choice-of-anchor J domain-containing protein [Bacteroidales bacterium]
MQTKTTFFSQFRLASLMLLLMLMFTTAGAQSSRIFPIEESFEVATFPPANWQIYDLDGGGEYWAATTTLNHTPDGSMSAYHSFAFGNQDGWLVTPAMDFPTGHPIVFTFWNYTLDPDYYGNNSVWISTGSGDPASGDFVQLWTADVAVAVWEQVILNLQSYEGQTAYVAFRYQGDFAHAWAVDDVFIGSDFNTAPQIVVNPAVLNITAPINTVVNKKLTIKNIGIDNLVYTLDFTYGSGTNGWLSIDPLSGDLGTNSSLAHILTFNPEGLSIGSTYTATITISSNDPELPEVTVPVNYTILEAANIDVTIMVNDYTFPYDISESGEYVVIVPFGGGGLLWSKSGGLLPINGIEPEVIAVAEDGTVAGTERNPEYNLQGQETAMAGLWHPQSGQWSFLPLNPEVGEPTESDYSSAWGMSADGSIVVGMQYYPNFQYKAFKWSAAGGYDMIGDLASGGNRPNGVSNDGSVVYGWADLPSASRSPVIWADGQLIEVAPDDYGEAMAASSTGEYVVGFAGDKGFIWSQQAGVELFPNTLNAGEISALAVLDDGTIFGYTVEGFPPFPDMRRAFVRMPDGEMSTFNDYALNRGMSDASDWLFYSINGATPDGLNIIGAGINPAGETVSFLIDFAAELPHIKVIPENITEALNPGESSTQQMEIQNTGNAPLTYGTFVNYLMAGKTNQPTAVPVGKSQRNRNLSVQSAPTKGGAALRDNARDDYFVLHYDGDNAEAVGLMDGGSMFAAARFPSEMVYPFAGATLQSVDFYVNDLPNESTLVIWGPGTTTTPGQVLHVQPFDAAPLEWNTITLDTPLELESTDIWIGVNYIHNAGMWVAGLDAGPANPNGDWVSMDGETWEHLSDAGLNNNLNIRGLLQLTPGEWLSLDPAAGTVPADDVREVAVNFTTTSMMQGVYAANIIIESNDHDTPYTVVPVTLDVMVGMNEAPMQAIRVYPVPASDRLNIDLVEGIESVRMFNSFGQLVREAKTINTLNQQFNLDGLNAGAYMLQFIGSTGQTHQQTIIISK